MQCWTHLAILHLYHRRGSASVYPRWEEILLVNVCGIVVWPLDSHAESPGSNPTIARYFCPSARHFIHIAALDPGVKWGPGRMRTELWLSWHVRACKMATGRNALQGVEKVHFECRIVPESYDLGNNTLWSALIIIWKSAILLLFDVLTLSVMHQTIDM